MEVPGNYSLHKSSDSTAMIINNILTPYLFEFLFDGWLNYNFLGNKSSISDSNLGTFLWHAE